MKLLSLLCFAVLSITLTLGLWPFHAPENEVNWLKGRNGVAFGKHGTVLSRGPLRTSGSTGSVEILVQPNRWTYAALLTFYRPDKRSTLGLLQSIDSFELTSKAQAAESHFLIEDAFGPSLRQGKPVLVTVTCGNRGVAVYRDGALAEAVPGFAVPDGIFAGWLVIGDSVGGSNSFRGDVLGLAIYDRELSTAEASSHYQSWKARGATDNSANALYLFDEKTGDVIRDHAAGGGDLYIPRKYKVVDEFFLRPVWEEFDFSGAYWRGNLKNIVGFIPTGFCFYAFLIAARPAKKALMPTLAVGFLVSLTIEVLQAFLPTRDSGMTDLITNTLGTYIGVLCYKRFSPLIHRSWGG